MAIAKATTPRKSGLVEHGPGYASGFGDLPRNLNVNTITAGIIATVFGCTGPALIVMNAAATGKLTQAQTISWLFSIYFFGGLLGILLAGYYKQPISGAWSIPGAVMLASAIPLFPFNQVVGAYFIAGVLVLLLGISGLIGKVMRWLPGPIVMAMIAGAMIRFGTGIVTSVQKAPLIAGIGLLVYLLMSRLTKKVSPVLGALVAGVIAALFFGGFKFSAVNVQWIAPQVFWPEFSLGSFLSIGIPLAALVVGAENAQAIGVLMAEGYKPPINMMTIVSGIGGIVTSFFGGHNANIAGPMTAICASSEAGEDKNGRYAASIVNGVTFGAFGLVASVAVPFVKALPADLVSLLAGLAMIGVLVSSFEMAFASKKFKVGAFFALVIAMSGITVLKISAPFWALVGGVVVSLLVEPKDFESNA
ncbi:benzoate/H(+) symporter BenE family transporter [Moorella sp. ACPs]|uniref:benzoate/H(+) symporter BenE family transporter n=1 Tax=Neomoorella carbonis TaxID=3062783 RepID=UPI0032450628